MERLLCARYAAQYFAQPSSESGTAPVSGREGAWYPPPANPAWVWPLAQPLQFLAKATHTFPERTNGGTTEAYLIGTPRP